MNYVDKYAPRGVDDLIGLDDEVSEILTFLQEFPDGKKNALLLTGPEGSGKTSTVYAVGESEGYNIIEVNASDKRNAENVRRIVGAASKQTSLNNKPKIILIDEVDGLHGNKDRGGVREINNVVKETKHPIIMTANDAYNTQVKSVKKNAKLVEFKRRNYWSVYNLLKKVSKKEGKNLSVNSLKKLASLAQGDVRSALNDLQNVSSDEEVSELYERVKETNIFDVLKIVFKSKSFESLKKALRAYDSDDLRTTCLWVAENIIKEYKKPSEVRRAYDWVSKSDVFFGRVHRRMYWRFLYYARLFFTIGVGLSKEEKYKGFTRYEFPVKIRKMGQYSSKRRELKALAKELGDRTHCSASKALNHYVPYYKLWNEELTD